MNTIRKVQILIAMNFQTLENAKFYSSKIKLVYNSSEISRFTRSVPLHYDLEL